MSDNGLPNPIRLRKSVDQIECIFDFAVERSVSCSAQVSGRIERHRLVGVAGVRTVVGRFDDQVLGVFEFLFLPESTEVVIHLKGVAKRVHAFMTLPAGFRLGLVVQALT